MPGPSGNNLYDLQQLNDALPDIYPITGVCVVADKSKCPLGFKIIDRSYYKDEDADLWKDSFFGKRVTRYICYTRRPSQEGSSHVVGDIALLSDKDDIPPGFTLIDSTTDTREKAMKKQLLCIKMVSMSASHDAVIDLVVTNRNRKTPPGFSIVGAASNMLLCYKYGAIPNELIQHSQSPYNMGLNLRQDMFTNSSPNGLPYPVHPNGHTTPTRQAPPPPVPPRTQRSISEAPSPAQTSNSDVYRQHSASSSSPSHASSSSPESHAPFMSTIGRRQSTMRGTNYMPQDDPYLVLRGIPFEINPKLTELSRLKSFRLPVLSHATETAIVNKYSYDFTKERTCLS